MQDFNKKCKNLIAFSVMSIVSGSVFAHGEAIRGGGGGSINAVGAIISEQSSVGVRLDSRQYEVFSDAEMIQFKRDGEDVHMHSSEDAYFISLGFPISEDMDISVLAQFNNFQGFKDNGDDFANTCFAGKDLQNDSEQELAKCISPTESSPGIGDTSITGRYRFYVSDENQFASIFGIILPTGTVTNTTDNGEIIGTHNQPGSGAITFQGGLGYNGHLLDSIDVTADVIFRTSTQGAKQFRTGRSMQADVAFSYAIGSFVPVIEVNYIKFLQDIENDEVKKNSGGESIAISPGVSYGITKEIGIYANYSYVINNLTGISNDEKYRFSTGIAYAFD